jgi:hypothetical protein
VATFDGRVNPTRTWRRCFGGEEGKVAKLEREGGLGIDHQVGCRLIRWRPTAVVDSECAVGKVKSGGGARAQPRHSEKSPRELKAQEGIE